MSYNKDTFLGSSNKNIKILDISGNLTYTINPDSIFHLSVSNNLVKVDLKDERIILLDFSDYQEAIQALNRLQVLLDSLRGTVTTKGIFIPTPIPFSTIGSNYKVYDPISETWKSHFKNEPLPDPIPNSWSEDLLKLTYESNDSEFLKYNPKYFLYVYKSHLSAYNKVNPNAHSNEKYKKSFVHPSNISYDSLSETYLANPTYINYSNGSDFNKNYFKIGFDKLSSEWDVNQGVGKSTVLSGFSPLRFYGPSGNTSTLIGDEFFPLSFDNRFDMTVLTSKTRRFPLNASSTRLNLYVKFAIVINNPLDTNRYIIGPFSETIKIYPEYGYFDTGQKYYYAWRVRRT